MTAPIRAPRDPRFEQLSALARLLDSSIRVPGTNFRFGLDAIIGLVPGIGDLAGAAISVFVMLQAARLGAPTATLLRMLANVGIEAAVGAVPLLGDLFDAAWKANLRNVRLLERYLEDPVQGARASRAWLVAVLLAALALLGLTAFAAWWVVAKLIELI